MSLFPITIGNNVYTGPGNDNVHISKAPGLLGALGLYEVDINGQKQYMTKQQLENTNFHLGAGNDTLVVDSNVTADIHADGGSGNDGNDYIDLGAGNDVGFGGRGNDVIRGGTGNDIELGGPGNDVLIGGPGWDLLFGGPGFDITQQ